MAKVQKQFLEFHDSIKLEYDDEGATLREKRDRVLDHLKSGLKKLFAEKQQNCPGYSTFNQGSYAMNTGIKPLDGDYDIDVGVCFNIKHTDYDPVEVKNWVYEALKNHTQRVEIRRSCVTVFYQHNDEPIYHVDLPIYAEDSSSLYLAKGKQNSSAENRFWEEADPKELIKTINELFKNSSDREQFRRVVRYLKRWKDNKFEVIGNAAPVGIALTMAAFYWFSPVYIVSDKFSARREYDDLEALINLVNKMLGNFRIVVHDSELAERLEIKLPVCPGNDLLSKMSNKQMGEFKAKLENLLDALKDAKEEIDPQEACKILRKQFGDDYSIPSKEETASKATRAIISSNSSAQ